MAAEGDAGFGGDERGVEAVMDGVLDEYGRGPFSGDEPDDLALHAIRAGGSKHTFLQVWGLQHGLQRLCKVPLPCQAPLCRQVLPCCPVPLHP